MSGLDSIEDGSTGPTGGPGQAPHRFGCPGLTGADERPPKGRRLAYSAIAAATIEKGGGGECHGRRIARVNAARRPGRRRAHSFLHRLRPWLGRESPHGRQKKVQHNERYRRKHTREAHCFGVPSVERRRGTATEGSTARICSGSRSDGEGTASATADGSRELTRRAGLEEEEPAPFLIDLDHGSGVRASHGQQSTVQHRVGCRKTQTR